MPEREKPHDSFEGLLGKKVEIDHDALIPDRSTWTPPQYALFPSIDTCLLAEQVNNHQPSSLPSESEEEVVNSESS